jgi:hypothetical protein
MGLIKLLNPKTSKQFFKEMQPRGLAANLKYLLIIAIPSFLGPFLCYSILGYSFTLNMGIVSETTTNYLSLFDGIKLGLTYYIGAVIGVFIMALLWTYISEKTFGKRIEGDESLTLMSYIQTPQLLWGIVLIFSLMGNLILVIGGLYSAVLFYFAIKGRYYKGGSIRRGMIVFLVLNLVLQTGMGIAIGSALPIGEMDTYQELTFFPETEYEHTINKEELGGPNGIGEWDSDCQEEFDYCRYEEHTRNKDDCYDSVAIYCNHPMPCGEIIDLEDRDGCYYDIGVDSEDANVCDNIADTGLKDDCYADVAYWLEDASSCYKISDIEDRMECVEDAT